MSCIKYPCITVQILHTCCLYLYQIQLDTLLAGNPEWSRGKQHILTLGMCKKTRGNPKKKVSYPKFTFFQEEMEGRTGFQIWDATFFVSWWRGLQTWSHKRGQFWNLNMETPQRHEFDWVNFDHRLQRKWSDYFFGGSVWEVSQTLETYNPAPWWWIPVNSS